MKTTEENLDRIREELESIGYSLYADLLSNYSTRYRNKERRTIAFLGDDLVGKSTIINMIIGETLLPTSVIPSLAEITLSYGEKETILTSAGEAARKDLSELTEVENSVEIIAPNNFLKDNAVVIKEFHGLLNKQKLSNITLMSEVYKCDAVVMVLSAEHLLSEPECIFIENYVRYVGANHLYIVINKLSSVTEGDVDHVLEYAQKQISGKFPNVKWSVYDNSEKFLPIIEKYANKGIKEETLLLVDVAGEQKSDSLRNMLQYIKERLQADVDGLKKDQIKELNEVDQKNKKLSELKKLEAASIEEALIEFRKKRNTAIDNVDEFIKNQFEKISSDLLNEYDLSSNKYNWYEKELEINWRKAVSVLSNQTDKFASEIILKDVEWINGILQTKLGLDPISFEISEGKMKRAEKLVPYGTYKKYASIGAGGMVVIGYCLFRIVGAVIGLGGGVLAYSYLGKKENIQADEIKREMSSKIRDVSAEVRKISRRDIETIYNNIVAEFEREANIIIESKYKFVDISADAQKERIDKILEVIDYIEEV